MTRDEAIAQSKRFLGSNTEEAIDLWAALGMLKLEEPKPKSVVKLFLEEFRACDECKKVAPIYVMDVIERAGLKLVEK